MLPGFFVAYGRITANATWFDIGNWANHWKTMVSTWFEKRRTSFTGFYLVLLGFYLNESWQNSVTCRAVVRQKKPPIPTPTKKRTETVKKNPKIKKKTTRPFDENLRPTEKRLAEKRRTKKKKKRKEKLGNSVVAVWRRGDDPPTEGPSSSAVSSLISRRRFHFQQSAIAQLRLIDFFSFLNGKKKQKKTRRASYFSLSQLFYRWPAAAIIDFYFSMESSAFHSFSVVPYVIYIIFHGFTSSSIRSKPLMGRWFFLENPTSAN